MDSEERTREIVREKYAAIAAGVRLPVAASCCDGSIATASFAEKGYGQMEGYAKDADLSLGFERERRWSTWAAGPATTCSSRRGRSGRRAASSAWT
jgi:hypothetical protein